MREAVDRSELHELQFHGDVGELVLAGSGHHRRVYVHPSDDHKCIKVMDGELPGKNLTGGGSEAARERAYYALLGKRGISFAHIAGYHGSMRVNYKNKTQMANVFDLIRNDNGEVSGTLDVEICRDDADARELADALHDLYLYLLRYKIISGFKMQNIVVQYTDGRPKCVLIDNIGNTDFIPVCDYVGWLATRKIERRWRHFLQKTLRKTSDNPVISEALRRARSG